VPFFEKAKKKAAGRPSNILDNMQHFLGLTTSQLSSVAYAQGASHVAATEEEFRAWMDSSEYVWVKANGIAGIRKLRGEEISSRARQCLDNYVQLGFRLGT
jgi:hypothetical protein